MPTRPRLPLNQVKYNQLLEPLFEFSGACAGCGETPYLKLLSQLFGDRTLVANATGCSSIYGANLPTTPWAKNDEGRGPAWSNSLFEDNAEFGLGMRVALDQRVEAGINLLRMLRDVIGPELSTPSSTPTRSTTRRSVPSADGSANSSTASKRCCKVSEPETDEVSCRTSRTCSASATRL
jgi:pyruvate/2-oxoacid:ferredoxin oxidoreductase beta subunit